MFWATCQMKLDGCLELITSAKNCIYIKGYKKGMREETLGGEF